MGTHLDFYPRRPFTQFEQRVNFAAVNDTFDKYESVFIVRSGNILKKQIKRLVTEIGRVLKSGNLLQLRDIKMPFHEEHVHSLQEAMDELAVRIATLTNKEINGKEKPVVSELTKQSNAVRAELVASAIEGKVLSQALLLVLEGKRRGKSDAHILEQLKAGRG